MTGGILVASHVGNTMDVTPASTDKLERRMYGWAAMILGLTASEATERGLDSMLSEIADHVPVPIRAAAHTSEPPGCEVSYGDGDEEVTQRFYRGDPVGLVDSCYDPNEMRDCEGDVL
jgi:hypothetical protein